MASRPTRLLAIASGGGHWVQLLRLRPAFAGCEVTYVTTRASNRCEVGDAGFHVVPECHRGSPAALVAAFGALLWIILRTRPDVIVSTGAAPGYLALRIGRWFGARTAWIDSIANAEELSLAGRQAGRCADLWLTQWPHLAAPTGPHYSGSVL